MSGRSFIDRAAEERRKCLVVGGIVRLGPRPFIGLELIEDSVHRLVGIGGLALPLHRVKVIHVGLVGLFIVAEQTHRISDLITNRSYSTTFGTRKKWFCVSGAFLTTSSAISPSLTTSARFFISIGVTEVIGSTPSTFTSESCSTKASMAFSSPCRWGTSASMTANRARCAMRRTVAASTDINIGLERGIRIRRIAEAAFAPQQREHAAAAPERRIIPLLRLKGSDARAGGDAQDFVRKAPISLAKKPRRNHFLPRRSRAETVEGCSRGQNIGRPCHVHHQKR